MAVMITELDKAFYRLGFAECKLLVLHMLTRYTKDCNDPAGFDMLYRMHKDMDLIKCPELMVKATING